MLIAMAGFKAAGVHHVNTARVSLWLCLLSVVVAGVGNANRYHIALDHERRPWTVLSSNPNQPLYQADVFMQWAVEAPSSLDLTIISFNTECSFDIVKVYDEYHTADVVPRAALSGSMPAGHVLTSKDSKILVTFDSDKNNVFAGFQLNVSIASDIAQPVVDTTLLQRAGHAFVNAPMVNGDAWASMWVWGGLPTAATTLGGALCFIKWTNDGALQQNCPTITPNSNASTPENRLFSQMSFIGSDQLAILGGRPWHHMSSMTSLSPFFWTFNTTSHRWQELSTETGAEATFLHSMSSVSNDNNPQLCVIGGLDTHSRFSQGIRVYDATTGLWRTVAVHHSERPDQVAGHTATYIEAIDSILVFGGYRPLWSRQAVKSSQLFALYVPTWTWIAMTHLASRSYMPPPLAMHSTTSQPGRLTVIGGQRFDYQQDNACQSTRVFYLDTESWRWTQGSQVRRQGRLAAASTAINASLVSLYGGFDGQLLQAAESFDVEPRTCWARNATSCLALPHCQWCRDACIGLSAPCNASTGPSNHDSSICASRTMCEMCTFDSVCAWDSSSGVCVAQAEATNGLSRPQACLTAVPSRGVSLFEWRASAFPAPLSFVDRTDTLQSLELVNFPVQGFSLGLRAVLSLSADHSVNVTLAASPPVTLYMWHDGDFDALAFPTTLKAGDLACHLQEVASGNCTLSGLQGQRINVELVFKLSSPSQSVNLHMNVSGGPINPIRLTPYQAAGSCSKHGSCGTCAADSRCSWCGGKCQARGQSCSDTSPVVRGQDCPRCSAIYECNSCSTQPDLNCVWGKDGFCHDMPFPVTDIVASCPRPCTNRTTCQQCLDQNPDDDGSQACVWCPATQTCTPLGVLPATHPFGQCSYWIDRESRFESTDGSDKCESCTIHKNVHACLASPTCGWCGTNSSNTDGVCAEGNSTTAYSGCPPTSPHAMPLNTTGLASNSSTQWPSTASPNVTSPSWFFTQFPLIDECSNGEALCGANSSCIDLRIGYTCQCDPGFEQDPDNSYGCLPKCSNCTNGVCAAPEMCECLPGWSGPRCERDCGCNFNALCPNDTAVGVCGPCLFHSTGPTCGQCLPGYYKRTGSPHCEPCKCNDHGDPERGRCDPVTGECYCTHYTTGTNCEACLPGFYGNPANGSTCYADCYDDYPRFQAVGWIRRVLLSEPQGGLGTNTLQSGKYRPDTTCQWFIQAPANHSIVLTFDSFRTECSYDYVHVFDGLDLKFDSPPATLGAFSGTQTQTVMSHGSSMLVMFYSDANFVLLGFDASYRFVSCSNNCSFPQGRCAGSHCECAPSWTGDDCSMPLCHDSCAHGTCDPLTGLCVCDAGYTGASCDVFVADNTTGLVWLPILTQNVQNMPSARSGHSIVHLESAGKLVLFGGLQGTAPLGDLWLADVRDGVWHEQHASIGATPSPRHLHTATVLGDKMLVYGGCIGSQQYSDELWSFDSNDGTWQQLKAGPKAVCGHAAATESSKQRMYVFGGVNVEHGLGSSLLVYSRSGNAWTTAPFIGSPPGGRFGPSMVADTKRRRLVLFGGRQARIFSNGFVFTPPSGETYQYDLDTGEWSLLPVSGTSCTGSDTDCRGRMLHSAMVIDDIMVVFGGDPFIHNQQNDCHQASVSVLDLVCDTWLDDLPVSGTLPMGRTAAGATLLPANKTTADDVQLLVHGGYAGQGLRDSWALPVPGERRDLCRLLHDAEACSVASFCTWTNGTCDAKEGPAFCAEVDCSELSSDCESCLATTACQICQSPAQGIVSCQQFGDPCDGLKNLRPSLGSSGGEHPCGRCTSKSNCQDCLAEADCAWSQNGRLCVEAVEAPAVGAVVSVEQCDVPCVDLIGCNACEGRRDCTWCEGLGQCISQFAYVTEFSFGQCLQLADRDRRGCPVETCDQQSTCDSCLDEVRCGWCGTNSTDGVCLAGTLNSPGLSTSNASVAAACPLSNRLPPTSPNATAYGNMTRETAETNVAIDWAYALCPDDDECEIDPSICGPHGTCINEDPREVIGSPGYRCVCGTNFTLTEDGLGCVPICTKVDCVNGLCSAPDTCSCFIGWTGVNCTQDCGCNGHCFCDQAGGPFQCDNTTTGTFCEECRPGFHGVAANNGTCRTCFETCNGHSNQCLQTVSPSGQVCFDCQDDTAGAYCESCTDGFFLSPALQLEARRRDTTAKQLVLDEPDVFSSCTPCMCNQHASTCDPDTGEGCPCKDDTMTDASTCDVDTYGSCYHAQCAVCTDTLKVDGQLLPLDGDPRNGGQCFVVPTVKVPIALTVGPRTSHALLISPSFINVDLRLLAEKDGLGDGFLTLAVYDTTNVSLSDHVPSSRVSPILKRVVRNRTELYIDHNQYDFATRKFAVFLTSEAEGVRTSFAATQFVASVDLFVFFSVFFSTFFLLLACVIGVVYIRAVYEERTRQVQEAIEMETMASRPLASVTTIFGPSPVFGQGAVYAAQAASNGSLPSRPISLQPLRTRRNLAVACFLVELPSSDHHRMLAVGSSLMRARQEDGTD